MGQFFKILGVIALVAFLVGAFGVAYCVTHCTDLGCGRTIGTDHP